MNTEVNFTLTDIDIFLRYYYHPLTSAYQLPDDVVQSTFAPFKYPELIQALYNLNYRKAYRLLNGLTELLSPEEAVAACLCAALGSDRLLNAVLDHCPPIPEFQFKGVGKIPNLVSFIVKYDLDKKLRILLHRGADPNQDSRSRSPLEVAFMKRSYSALWELLQAPDLTIDLTEPILDAWGKLSASPDAEGKALLFQWCCRLICQKVDPDNYRFPSIMSYSIPPQLRPRHALAHNNQLLAAKICDINPLSEEDLDDLRTHFGEHFPPPTDPSWDSYTALLKSYLQHIPDNADKSHLRRVIACAAAGSPTPDEEILAFAAQLADGPVHLKAADISYLSNENCISFFYFLLETFLSQWTERLGDRLPPALDLSELTPKLINLIDSTTFLRALTFTGSLTAAQWDELLPMILHKFRSDEPFDLLMQPGRILSHVPEDKLLSVMPSLPLKQRAVVLLHINQSSDYDL